MVANDLSRREEVGCVHGEVFREVLPPTAMVEEGRSIDLAMLAGIEAEVMTIDTPVSTD